MVSTRCCDHKPRETGWGYTRIMGELKKLGGKPPSRTTVKNILKENGFDSGPYCARKSESNLR